MENLITVNYDNERPLVSARELHEFLEVKTAYKDWFPRMCNYGFDENADYIAIAQKRATAQGNMATYYDHQLTIEMAKEICMLQRNEKGKQARQYFISLEKMWNSPEMIMKRALEFANKQVETLQNQIEHDKPKVLFADAVTASHTSILVGELAKILKQNGVEIGQNRLFQWLRDNGYLIKRRNKDGKPAEDWNMPTQRSMEMGLFQVKETVITHSDGHTSINKTVKITGKGQQYFINKLVEVA